MSIFDALTIVVGLVCAVNLLLTFGVIRRLREHTELLAAGGADTGTAMRVMLEEGERPTDFSATTLDGDVVTARSIGGLIGFFSPDCPPCQERARQFADYAADLPGGRDQALAVVVRPPGHDDADSVTAMAALLAGHARVVMEGPGGPVATAFEVAVFPALGLLDQHATVLKSASVFGKLPIAALSAAR